ncbi:MAG: YncE family protein [Gemmatimonadales bacterium]|nr:YncE family protein [Gemmatimonadales bacterium]
MRIRLLLAALAALATPAAAQEPGYRVGVVSESGDIITWLRPGAGTLVTDRVVPIGVMPADIDGPHNIAAAPDGKSYFVTIAHGTPYGTLWHLDARTDAVLGRAPVELFPTTVSPTPDGELAFVANSDFHGDRPRENVLSIIHVPQMQKITDIPVCDMPHGVKVNHAGTKLYVTCMHSDELLEVDVSLFGIQRRVKVGGGHGMAGMDHGAMAPRPAATAPMPGGPMGHGAHGGPAAPANQVVPAGIDTTRECSPTFIAVSPDDRRLYSTCNYGNSVMVWDAATWALVKEVPTGKGAYNVEPSPDGKWVIASNKKEQSASIIDARTLTEVARVRTTKPIVHGVAYSPDSRYAFVTAESVGADPGSIDMIDLATFKVVATVPLPAQPTGVAIVPVSR